MSKDTLLKAGMVAAFFGTVFALSKFGRDEDDCDASFDSIDDVDVAPSRGLQVVRACCCILFRYDQGCIHGIRRQSVGMYPPCLSCMMMMHQ